MKILLLLLFLTACSNRCSGPTPNTPPEPLFNDEQAFDKKEGSID